MKSTKDRILQTLLNNPKSTITDLAKAVDINSISVRHHLTNLLAEGLIQAQEERHGVGRPRLVYSLTETGVEKFPTMYLNLTNRLLFYLKKRLSQKEIEIIFIHIAEDLAQEQKSNTQNMTVEEKLNYLQSALLNEGFIIEWKKEGNEYIINEVTCPFYHIRQNHPEVCTIDQTLLSNILTVPVDKIHCVLNGDNQCSYIIDRTAFEAKA